MPAPGRPSDGPTSVTSRSRFGVVQFFSLIFFLLICSRQQELGLPFGVCPMTNSTLHLQLFNRTSDCLKNGRWPSTKFYASFPPGIFLLLQTGTQLPLQVMQSILLMQRPFSEFSAQLEVPPVQRQSCLIQSCWKSFYSSKVIITPSLQSAHCPVLRLSQSKMLS